MDPTKLGNAFAFWMHDLWSIPLVLVCGTALLYQYLGTSALIGVGSLFLMLPLNVVIQGGMKK